MEEIQQRLEALRDELTRHAAVRAVEVSREVCDDAALTGYWSFRVHFHGRKGRQWTLTDDETAMDPHALGEWMRRIRTETSLLCTRDEVAEQFTIGARQAHAMAEQHFRDLRRQIPRIWNNGRLHPGHRKARELFIKTAGLDAYQMLNNGGELLVTGSAGTPYVLTKRASFCLRNTRTGVEYCAVVPGVPLWDHLLGVKLMVEHDEPQLLAVANSSIGITRYLRA